MTSVSRDVGTLPRVQYRVRADETLTGSLDLHHQTEEHTVVFLGNYVMNNPPNLTKFFFLHSSL